MQPEILFVTMKTKWQLFALLILILFSEVSLETQNNAGSMHKISLQLQGTSICLAFELLLFVSLVVNHVTVVGNNEAGAATMELLAHDLTIQADFV